MISPNKVNVKILEIKNYFDQVKIKEEKMTNRYQTLIS